MARTISCQMCFCQISADLFVRQFGLDACVQWHLLVGQPTGRGDQAVEFGAQFDDQLRVFSFVDQVVPFGGVALDVVQFGLVAILGTIAVRVADVFPLIGSYATNVGRVGELFLVVVFVIPARAPKCVAFGNEFPPGFSMNLGEGIGAAEQVNARPAGEGASPRLRRAAGGGPASR